MTTEPEGDDAAAERDLRGARLTASVMRRQLGLIEAARVAPDVVTTAVLGVAIERLVGMHGTEFASAWLAGIADALAGERNTAGSA